MDIESATTSFRQTRKSSRLSEKTPRSRSSSTNRGTDGKCLRAKASSTLVTPKPKESKKKKAGQKAAMSATLLKAGVTPPGKEIGTIPKRTPDKEYVVDYSRDIYSRSCPPPTFQVSQPSGSHSAGSPSQPKSTWETNTHMSQATLHGHIQAIAEAGYQHALYRTFQGLVQTRNEAYHVWDR